MLMLSNSLFNSLELGASRLASPSSSWMQLEKHGFTMVSRRMLVLVLRISVRMISLPQNPKAILYR